MNKRTPTIKEIKRIIKFYNGKIRGSAEAIINYLDYIHPLHIYRIIYNYRANLKPLNDYSDADFIQLLQPIPYINGVFR